MRGELRLLSQMVHGRIEGVSHQKQEHPAELAEFRRRRPVDRTDGRCGRGGFPELLSILQ